MVLFWRASTHIQAAAEELVVVPVLGGGSVVAPTGGTTGRGQHHAVGIDLLQPHGQKQGHAEQVLHGVYLYLAFTFTMPHAWTHQVFYGLLPDLSIHFGLRVLQ